MSNKFRFASNPIEVPKINTKHRRIVTKIPVPQSLPILEAISKYESSNVKDFPPIIWSRAKDYTIEDDWGNRWIDMTSAIFVANAGHGNVIVQNRIRDVLDKPLMHSYCYPTLERVKYLEKLARFVPPYFEKFSLYSSGTEATERALKLSRLHGRSISSEKNIIVTGLGNYHGKTLGAQMLSGRPQERDWIGFQDPNIYHLPFPFPWDLEKMSVSGSELFLEHLKDLEQKGVNLKRIAAFMIESFQGWGAVFYPDDYVTEMANFASENKSLLVCDEIQAGFGRTGKLFAYQHYGVQPDIVCCGKAASNSMPLSIVLATQKIIDLDPTYTSTHGGHPFACAAGLGTLEAFEEMDLINESKRKEQIFNKYLSKIQETYPKIVPLSLGRGMLHALFITDPNADPSLPIMERLDFDLTDKIVEKAMQNGLFLIRTGCGTLKFGPPLMTPDEVLEEALTVLEKIIKGIYP
ncbi:MAG: aspartate aminotransferase family protein [Nitrosomonadaceae bacterium]|nr:aspartate aminotransferase family protein [Nitrosomonadaceae bacterium]|tara:strand:+ start:1286 stop:2680 length:1395 start_codon:yes stop_codon:yes gene_type:complete